MPSFSVFRLWHTYAHSHPNWGSKWSPKKQSYVKKNFFLWLYFRDEGHLYAKCLFDIFTIYPKCHRFNFFSRGIHMYIPILTGVQNGRISHLNDSVFLLNNVLFEASFPWWRSLVCQLLVYIPTIYPKCHLFQFFSRGIRMYIPILTGDQNGRFNS